MLDWAGYGNDGGQAMFAAYVKKHPKNKPQFTYMTNESDALAKMHAGLKPDIFRPYVGWVKYFAQSGLVEPWDPKLIPSFKNLNPFMVKAGQYNGKQYGIPEDWGFDAVLYRSDKVHPKAKSWSLLFDERYKGRIAWFDDLNMLVIAGLLLHIPKPWHMTDAQLEKAQKFLISKKHLARMIWSSETDMDNAFASGDIWIAYAWPNDWVQMRAKKLKVVYMRPKELPVAWVGMLMLGKGTPRRKLAHAYADAWSSTASAKWLENNYGYGHANTKARPSLERPAARAAADQPEGRHRTERPPRPRHPPASGLRPQVGRGQGVLSVPEAQARRRRLRLDPTTPALLGLPLAWLAVFFLVPIAIVGALQRRQALARPRPARGHARGLARLPAQPGLPEAVLEVGRRCRWSSRSSSSRSPTRSPTTWRCRGTKRKYVLLLLLIAPFLTSYLLRVLAWKVILGNQGVINSFVFWTGLRSPDHPISQLLYSRFAVMLVLGYIWLPFVALPIFVTLESLDRRLFEAATDLGASRWQTFRRVTLPLSLPGVMAAFLFVFIPTLGEFVTPSLVGGASGYMYGNQIVDLFGTGFPDWQTGSVLALFLLGVVAVLTIVFSRFLQTREVTAG